MKTQRSEKNDKPDYAAYMSTTYSQLDHTCCYCGKLIEDIKKEEKIAEPPWKEGFPLRKFPGNLCHKGCEIFISTITENSIKQTSQMKIIGEVIEHNIHYDIYENGSKISRKTQKIAENIQEKPPSTIKDVENYIDEEQSPKEVPLSIYLYDLFLSFVKEKYSDKLSSLTIDRPFLDIKDLEKVEKILILCNINPIEAYREFIYKFDKAIKGEENASLY